jgi:AAA+ superfamily predicted ATPase
MPVAPEVLAALEAALAADPGQDEVRQHLASLLLQAGRPQEALEHASQVLSRRPDSLDALRVAADAAAACGQDERAAGYRRLLTALGGGPASGATGPAAGPDSSAPRVLPPGVPTSPTDQDQDRTDPELPELEDTDPNGKVVPLRAIDGGGEVSPDLELPRVTLADVGGMEHVKRRLQTAFLGPMRNPSLRSLFGKSLRGGLLLYGPPGCGKTFVARATAGEMGAKFLAVALSDILDMWLGNSEKNLHDLFETARRNAPCVIFFDEIDALGQKRSHMRHHAGRNVSVQLLHEMDNATNSNEGVFVLAATNHPWDVDTALRRPGRLDRTLLVLPPDRPAREAIIRLHLRDRPLENVDVRKLAEQTDGYSGADLAHLCETAAEIALDDSLARGTARPITMADLTRARKEVRPSTGAWFEMARNYASFANEGGVYDDLLDYLRTRR